ncbi:hypothetical protein GC163_19230 [bacterium]|nr:hypothetical protein [bacterium]
MPERDWKEYDDDQITMLKSLAEHICRGNFRAEDSAAYAVLRRTRAKCWKKSVVIDQQALHHGKALGTLTTFPTAGSIVRERLRGCKHSPARQFRQFLMKTSRAGCAGRPVPVDRN